MMKVIVYLLILFFFVQVEAIDLLPLQFYTEYQWLTDFSLCAVVVYVLTEAYYVVSQHHIEFNASVLWCLLTIAFCMKVLVSQAAIYMRTEEGGEKVYNNNVMD